MITNAFKNSRSEYTLGCPRPRLVGSGGIGKRSTNWTNVTSNESWDTIGEPPILVVVDYHNDRSKPSLEQPSSEPFLFMTRPRLGDPVVSCCPLALYVGSPLSGYRPLRHRCDVVSFGI